LIESKKCILAIFFVSVRDSHFFLGKKILEQKNAKSASAEEPFL
jgi:hypothetical protein